MSPLAWLVVATAAGAAGVAITASGVRQPRASLRRVMVHLRRDAEVADERPVPDRNILARIGEPVARAGREVPGAFPSAIDLRLVGRSAEVHGALLLLAALAGLLVPSLALTAMQYSGAVSVTAYVPLGAALVGALVAPLTVHLALIERAREVRGDLRHQLSAYLDVVTMLLAGNTGHEGALEQAARAGDGRLFRELRRRVREVGARGQSLVEALSSAGRQLGLVELEQVAATAALSAAEGAPVARTLAAKCATLRSTLATEQESEARLRTSRLTAPIVGMALIFMALVIYPALTFT